jgi:hypothetical protein
LIVALSCGAIDNPHVRLRDDKKQVKPCFRVRGFLNAAEAFAVAI